MITFGGHFKFCMIMMAIMFTCFAVFVDTENIGFGEKIKSLSQILGNIW